MQRAMSILLLGALAGCSSGTEPTERVDAEVTWLEWPAEVVAGTPFTVRLSGYGADCREVVQFSYGPTVDNSAVTFSPYFVVTTKQIVCPLYARLAAGPESPIASGFDTVATVGGLAAETPRTYEMRAAANVSAPAGGGFTLPASLPIRTFGEILVRPDSADASHTNAGGSVYAYRDSVGCLHVHPLTIVFLVQGGGGGGDPPDVPFDGFVVENPPDTTSYWSGFISGYLYKPAQPFCGKTQVFHLSTRQ